MRGLTKEDIFFIIKKMKGLTNFNQQRIAVYPGAFDPVTNGHLDVILRATKLFDQVIVAVTDNPSKPATLPAGDRVKLLQKILINYPRVKVEYFKGLLVDYLKRKKAQVIIRGLRAISDFDYEFQIASMNRQLYPEAETVFLMPDESYTYLSSSLVKEIARLGGKVEGFVPEEVEKFLQKKLKK